MAEFKNLVVVKFKEQVVVEKLASEIDTVKSFVWGEDIESMEMLRQGFTHALLMTFETKEDYIAFQTHPNHVDFLSTFSAAIEKIVLLDFPAVLVKPYPAPIPTTESAPSTAPATAPVTTPATAATTATVE